MSNVGIALGGGASAAISRVSADAKLVHGIAIASSTDTNTTVVISDSGASQNPFVGFDVLGVGVSSAGFGGCSACTNKVAVLSSVASNNNHGFNVSGAGASLSVSNSAATSNRFFGFRQMGGTFQSAQNNLLTDNASGPTSGTIVTGGVLF